MRLHPQKVQYGNFRFVMEEMTSFVFCQVPWENRVVNMKALFAFTPLQVNNFSATTTRLEAFYFHDYIEQKVRPTLLYHLMATSHIIWVNFAK